MDKEIGKLLLPFILLLAFILALVLPALAQAGDGYDLSWSTVDGGGWTFSEGGGYKLGSTIGQPDAGVMSDGDYTLSAGFWGGIVEIIEELYRLYLPFILKNYGP